MGYSASAVQGCSALSASRCLVGLCVLFFLFLCFPSSVKVRRNFVRGKGKVQRRQSVQLRREELKLRVASRGVRRCPLRQSRSSLGSGQMSPWVPLRGKSGAPALRGPRQFSLRKTFGLSPRKGRQSRGSSCSSWRSLPRSQVCLAPSLPSGLLFLLFSAFSALSFSSFCCASSCRVVSSAAALSL